MSTTTMEDVFKAGYEAGQDDIQDGRGDANEAYEDYRYEVLLKSAGKETADAWLKARKAPLDSKPQDLKCPDCGGEMTPRSSQYGKFWGCVKYPRCKGTRDSEGLSKAERAEQKRKEGDYAEDVPVESGELYKFKKG